jgi:hypothetical protein
MPVKIEKSKNEKVKYLEYYCEEFDRDVTICSVTETLPNELTVITVSFTIRRPDDECVKGALCPDDEKEKANLNRIIAYGKNRKRWLMKTTLNLEDEKMINAARYALVKSTQDLINRNLPGLVVGYQNAKPIIAEKIKPSLFKEVKEEVLTEVQMSI